MLPLTCNLPAGVKCRSLRQVSTGPRAHRLHKGIMLCMRFCETIHFQKIAKSIPLTPFPFDFRFISD